MKGIVSVCSSRRANGRYDLLLFLLLIFEMSGLQIEKLECTRLPVGPTVYGDFVLMGFTTLVREPSACPHRLFFLRYYSGRR